MPHLPEPPTHLATAHRTWSRLQELRANPAVDLDGNSLDIASVVAVAYHGCLPKLSSDPSVIGAITDSVRVLMDHLDHGYCVYGVNTGFGGSADSRTDQASALQAALLQLTQAGVLTAADKTTGDARGVASAAGPTAMPSPWVRASIVVRANSNARGHSAVTLNVLEGLLDLLRHRITPVIPLRGSVSASGDLMPLSYIAGAVEGSPDIYVQVANADPSIPPQVMSAHDALAAAGIPRRVMGPKEGLGLVNGTACSAALASLALHESHQLAITTQALGAMGVEAMMGTAESFHPFISATRPHPGQIECARNVLALLQGSRLAVGVHREKDRKRSGLIQDRYAWRSVPQWVGPQLEDLLLADRQLTTELNSSCDNPLVDTENSEIYCGANFQAAAVTSAMEKTRLSLQMLGKILFAQATELVDPNYNNGLPTNLVADDPSCSFTMKGVDISMAAYMSELAYLAHPVSAHVQTAEMRNQAVNSLAFISARYTMQAVELVSLMSAAYLYIACQALDLRALHLRFLETMRPRVEALTRTSFASLPADVLEALIEKLLATLTTTWGTTTRVSLPDRFAQTVQAAIPVIVDHTASVGAAGAAVTLGDITAWKTQAIAMLGDAYSITAETFKQRPHTPELLGAGAKVLYTLVREQLGVPFHQGFVEHPTPGATELDGREKKTVGSWVSVIYEAVRRGELVSGLFEKVMS
ncbi:aromatic amino acid ammonia-lyase [Aspergillus homomorphus CBS 101889]|uniref:Phenylalanine ammonia-lyase n=1 Tax=Aspergillus homomorphus (strain CBS 101889) TaxID=1450537 RepID=A0A395I3J9_ASPHC|nr:phenylalanine ammonia-lyase [Aspergillus homomorphus CBS 101889]RAL14782.1 phenylalanine ammonia-lyase [Aspergillus homomorphus CBS 101889]